MDGQTAMGLMGVDRMWEMGGSDTGVMRTNAGVMGTEKKTLAVTRGDEEGQTDAGLKETDRLIALRMDRQTQGPWARRVAGSVRCLVSALKGLAQAASLPVRTRDIPQGASEPEAGLSMVASY